ncbi:hypothetical protein PEDI_55640 [Persicobacter diffluens]|uniref:Uncharacterized protein n=1 Tax=Persicobacter diffluens TaxID=981 RepID=A0AAN4W629_9BACT|nr:hypothetical protein PEDI_55640 [Persicobacter diffluens]
MPRRNFTGVPRSEEGAIFTEEFQVFDKALENEFFLLMVIDFSVPCGLLQVGIQLAVTNFGDDALPFDVEVLGVATAGKHQIGIHINGVVADASFSTFTTAVDVDALADIFTFNHTGAAGIIDVVEGIAIVGDGANTVFFIPGEVSVRLR